MKRLLLSLTVLLGLLLVGCGQKQIAEPSTDPIEDFKNFVRNDIKITSGTVEMNVRFKMNSKGLLVEMDLPIKMDIAEDGGIHLLMKENAFLGEIELYMIDEEETPYIYMSSNIIDTMLGITNDTLYWIKTEVSEENSTSIPDNLLSTDLTEEEIEKYINKYVTVEHIVYIGEENNIKHYQLIVNDELLSKLSEDFDFEYTSSGMEFKVDVYYDKTNLNPTRISADFNELIKSLMENLSKEELESIQSSGINLEDIVEFSITVEFSNLNNTIVEIPVNIKENAVTEEEYTEILTDIYYQENGLLMYQ